MDEDASPRTNYATLLNPTSIEAKPDRKSSVSEIPDRREVSYRDPIA